MAIASRLPAPYATPGSIYIVLACSLSAGMSQMHNKHEHVLI